MKRTMLPVILIALSFSLAHAEEMASEPYELAAKERATLRRLIRDAGHTRNMTEVSAREYENGNIGIRVELEPVAKEKFTEKTCLSVAYDAGEMRLSQTTRMVRYGSAESFFPVGSGVSDGVVVAACERYLRILEEEEFPFIALGGIRGLWRTEESYVLSIAIAEETRYAFTLILDKEEPGRVRRIEIQPLVIS
jgi:hypothetical protein